MRVTDSSGRATTSTIDVGYWEALVVSPTSASLSPRASRPIQTSGGSAAISPVVHLERVGRKRLPERPLPRRQQGQDGGRRPRHRRRRADLDGDILRRRRGRGHAEGGEDRSARPHRFRRVGGSGLGFVWSISQNPSGGSIDATTGVYNAGSSTHVVDVVRATDSLGNVGEVSVSIGGGVAIEPLWANSCPRGTHRVRGIRRNRDLHMVALVGAIRRHHQSDHRRLHGRSDRRRRGRGARRRSSRQPVDSDDPCRTANPARARELVGRRRRRRASSPSPEGAASTASRHSRPTSPAARSGRTSSTEQGPRRDATPRSSCRLGGECSARDDRRDPSTAGATSPTTVSVPSHAKQLSTAGGGYGGCRAAGTGAGAGAMGSIAAIVAAIFVARRRRPD